MKILYFDCGMGAAGDMLMASLLELVENPARSLERLNAMGLPGVHVSLEPSEKCGITGSRAVVRVSGTGHTHCHAHSHAHAHTHEHGHEHRSLGEIERIIEGLRLPETVRSAAAEVYRILARAEGRVHGRAPGEVHFHEAGTLDAIADIAGVCLLMEELAPQKVVASPINVGSGQVHCAHGVLPVPAPATAQILQDMPIYGSAIDGELCTPTGAALLKYFAEDFGPLPSACFSKVGYGMGSQNFPRANCLRAFLGEEGRGLPEDRAQEGSEQEDRVREEDVHELSCNLDDMTPEAVAYVQELLLGEGALDVYTLSAGMKKGRPGLMLCCLCGRENRRHLAQLILRHTSTLGVRETLHRRYVLPRGVQTLETDFGPVRVKTARGNLCMKHKAEYEDVARIARERHIPFRDVLAAVERVLP